MYFQASSFMPFSLYSDIEPPEVFHNGMPHIFKGCRDIM